MTETKGTYKWDTKERNFMIVTTDAVKFLTIMSKHNIEVHCVAFDKGNNGIGVFRAEVSDNEMIKLGVDFGKYMKRFMAYSDDYEYWCLID